MRIKVHAKMTDWLSSDQSHACPANLGAKILRNQSVWTLLLCGVTFSAAACAIRNPASSSRQNSASDPRKVGARSLHLDDCIPDENGAPEQCVNPPPPDVAPPPAPLADLDGVSVCKATTSSDTSLTPWTMTDEPDGKVRCKRFMHCVEKYSPSETSNLVCAPELAAACAALPPFTKDIEAFDTFTALNPDGLSCDALYLKWIRDFYAASDPSLDTPEKLDAKVAEYLASKDPVEACRALSSLPPSAQPIVVSASCSQRIPDASDKNITAVATQCPPGQTMGAPTEVSMCRLNWNSTPPNAGWAYVAEFGLNQGQNVDFVCQYRQSCSGYGTLSNQSSTQPNDFDSQGNLTRMCTGLGGDDCSVQNAAMIASLAAAQAVVPVLPTFRWNGVPPNQSETSLSDYRTYVDQTCTAAVAAQKLSLDASAASDCRAKADTIMADGPKTLISCCQAGAPAP